MPQQAAVATQAPDVQVAPAPPRIIVNGQNLQIPRTAAEVEGMRSRIEILEDQLEEWTDRRDELARELRNAPGEAGNAGIQARIAQLDTRILQIETDITQTEQLLTNTSPDVLASAVEHVEVDTSGMVDEDDATFVAFLTFGIGVVGTIVAGRVRRRRAAKRNAGASGQAVATGHDPRIERLTQAVDAIAEEVERIGEGQRFVTNLLAERREPAPMARAEERR